MYFQTWTPLGVDARRRDVLWTFVQSVISSCCTTRNRAALSMALVTAMAACRVIAADEFPVTPTQIQAMGIRTVKLDAPANLAGIAYPARVALPRGQEQILTASVAGVVDQILVDDHANVEAGQPLLRLNSPEFGELQLKLLEVTNHARVADSTLRREKSLFAEGIIPERRVIEASAAASDGRARVHQAEAAIRLAGVDDATARKIGSGQVQERLVLRASRSSTVLAIDVKPGQRVAAADPLLRLGELGRLWLDIELPAERASSWRKDGRIQIVGRQASASPLSVAATVSDSQTVTLRAQVDEGADTLRPGEFVQAQVPLAIKGDAWTLPIAAVAHQDKSTVVFVRTASGFVARPISIVASSGQSLSVSGALQRGDEIAIAAVIALKAAWLGESGAEEE